MKIWNYVVIITGISIFMAIAGIPVAGFTDLFNKIGLTIGTSGIDNFGIDSFLWSFVFGTSGLLILLGTSGAVGVGTFVYTKDKSFLMIPVITSVLFYWISVLISIINYLRDYPVFGTISGLIWIPLTIGFIISCVEWFMGTE